MDSVDWILLIWLGFPPIALLFGWLYSRRIRLKPTTNEREEDQFTTFVPSTYAYYPMRNRQDTEPPSPAVTTYQKDSALSTLSVALGIAGLYLPLTGILPGLVAMLAARPVLRRENYQYCRAACGFCLGAMTLVQTVLYFIFV